MKTIRNITIILLFILGLGALYGGIMLIVDPTGELLQLPISLLDDSIFKDFLVPGILLFTLNGLLSIIIAIMLILRKRWAWLLVIIQGLIIAIWITVQIIVIDSFFPPAHIPYYLIGIALIYLGRRLSKASLKS